MDWILLWERWRAAFDSDVLKKRGWNIAQNFFFIFWKPTGSSWWRHTAKPPCCSNRGRKQTSGFITSSARRLQASPGTLAAEGWASPCDAKLLLSLFLSDRSFLYQADRWEREAEEMYGKGAAALGNLRAPRSSYCITEYLVSSKRLELR